MKIKTIISTTLPLLIILGLISAMLMKLNSNKKNAESEIFHYNKDQSILVKTDTLTLDYVAGEKSYTGVFEPYKETKISADVQGKIESVLVDIGDVIHKGQPLIYLDRSLLQLQLESADIQIEDLKSDIDRFTILAEAEAIEGIKLEKARIGLKTAIVNRATLLKQIEKTTIRAPFDGVVTMKMTEEGGFAAPGMPLLQITDISKLRFTVQMPEKDLVLFRLNEEYEVTSDVFPDLSLKGKSIMIGSKSNPVYQFPVQFLIKNPPKQPIKAGMFGQVFLTESSEDPSIVIPSSAIMGDTDRPKVYLIKNGRAVLQNINISGYFQNKAMVTDGLYPGDVLIVSGFINLFDGANVKTEKY